MTFPSGQATRMVVVVNCFSHLDGSCLGPGDDVWVHGFNDGERRSFLDALTSSQQISRPFGCGSIKGAAG
jgi:hypothetical protein